MHERDNSNNHMSSFKSKALKQVSDKYLEYLTRDLLRELGNLDPTKKQIKLLSGILSTVAVSQNILFDDQLTDREICCLYWASMGKTSTQTAVMLNVQRFTVEQYRKEIKRKLGCKTITEAVFKGMRFGYMGAK